MTTQTLPIPHGTADSSVHTDARATVAPAQSRPHLAGMLWFAGWLFTIGYAQLPWWKAIVALVIWPYCLGDLLR